MSFEQILFYTFAAVLIGSAVMVITARNPVHSALYLVLAFFTSACLWMMLEAEFLAIVLVLVYVGAVMVLFLFVVMMLDINLAALRAGFARYLPIALVVGIAIVVQMIMVLQPETLGLDRFIEPQPHPADYSNTEALGAVLYTEYMYPFEIAAVLLLIAIVAAITLTLRRREGVKSQHPSEQVAVRKEDRVRVVSMQSESKE